MSNSAEGELHFLHGTGQRVPVSRAWPGKLGVTCQNDGKVSGNLSHSETARSHISLVCVVWIRQVTWCRGMKQEKTLLPGWGSSPSGFASLFPTSSMVVQFTPSPELLTWEPHLHYLMGTAVSLVPRDTLWVLVHSLQALLFLLKCAPYTWLGSCLGLPSQLPNVFLGLE